MKHFKGYLISLIVFAVLFSSSSCKPPAQKTEVPIEPTIVLPPTETKPASTEQIAQETEDPVEPTPTTQPTTFKHTLSFEGMEWTYWVHIPLGLNDTQPAPVVFVFHGIAPSKPQSMFKAGFNPIADQDKFIVVYPHLPINHQMQTDVVRQILSDLGTFVSIDPKRIYATGFSMGSYLSFKLACNLSDTFAAIAPVGGLIHCSYYEPHPQPEHEVSVIIIFGLKDINLLKFDPPVDEILDFWVGVNDCKVPAQVEKKEFFTHTSYAPCQDGSAVELYTIDAMSHKWPTDEMPAAEIIWEFFKAHPKP